MHSNKVLKNAIWIIGCRVIQSLLALLINMLTARYLGPAGFGIINYAASLVAFFIPIMQLGLNSILVKEMVTSPQREGEILGTSIVLSLCSAFLSIGCIISFVLIANPGESETLLVVFLYSLVLIFQAAEMTQYWFQARLLSKYTAVTMLIAYFVVSVYRIVLLASQQSVYWFAISNAFDYMIIAVVLLVLHKKISGCHLRFSMGMAKELLSKGRYFIVSSLMITVFSQTDKVMLKIMLGESETGYYSAAVSCALITNFVFAAILDSSKPILFESKNKDQRRFEEYVVLLFGIINFISLCQCIFMTLFAKCIVGILYGSAYEPSVDILRLAVWYTTFSYLGTVRNIWIVAEGKQQYLWIINLCGAVSNVVLNYILIHHLNAFGAALASVIAQFIANVLVVQCIGPLRASNRLLLKSLNPKRIILNMQFFLKQRNQG